MDYILIGKKGGRFGEGPDDRIDFRLILTHLVQKVIVHKMRQSSVGILAMAPHFIVMEDFSKIWARYGLGQKCYRMLRSKMPTIKCHQLGSLIFRILIWLKNSLTGMVQTLPMIRLNIFYGPG